MTHVVFANGRRIRMPGQRRMEDLADPAMRGEECGNLRRRGRTARVPLTGYIEAGHNGAGPPPVENPAAHGHEVHYPICELRVVGGQVAPQVAIVSAQRLRTA